MFAKIVPTATFLFLLLLMVLLLFNALCPQVLAQYLVDNLNTHNIWPIKLTVSHSVKDNLKLKD